MSSISNRPDELVGLTRRIDGLRREMGTHDRPFQHWIKMNSIDPAECARVRKLGPVNFVLYGDGLWGPGQISFETRRRRLKEAAMALGLTRR
jgi:hypothetical protein